MVDRSFTDYRERAPEWTLVGSSTTGGSVSVTSTAVTGESHYLQVLSASIDTDAKVGLVKVFDGSTGGTVIHQFYAHNADHFEFDAPLKTTAGNALTVKMAASGSAISILSAAGFTA